MSVCVIEAYPVVRCSTPAKRGWPGVHGALRVRQPPKHALLCGDVAVFRFSASRCLHRQLLHRQFVTNRFASLAKQRGLARSARAVAMQIGSNPREGKPGCAQRGGRRYCNKTFVFDGQNTCCQDLVSGNT